jgi:ATP-dependent DNA helicase DinG
MSSALAGFEHRPAQLMMTQVVQDILTHSGVAFMEAGTGTGKTLAYLVPALLSDKKVIVSTGTKTLQDQIMASDLPRIEQALGIEINAVCVKGLTNYVCLRRFNEFKQQSKVLESNENIIDQVNEWVEVTHSGDKYELGNLPEDSPIFRHIMSSSETRIGSRCTYYEQCFITRLKAAAQAAQLLVVNHHLFFSSLAIPGSAVSSIIPAYDAVIFDEAHQIEDVMTEYFGVQVSSRRVETLCRDARRIVVELAKQSSVEPLLREVAFQASQFFHGLLEKLGAPSNRVALADSDLAGEQQRKLHQLDTALEELHSCLMAKLTSDPSVGSLARRTRSLRDDFSLFVERKQRNHVQWAEVRDKNTVLGASPIEVADVFRTRVLDVTGSVVCTSATLSTGGSFEFIKHRLGIDREIDECVFESPFDYHKQAALFVPAHLPDCREPAYLTEAAKEISRLIALAKGGAFVLCTSIKAVHELSNLFRPLSSYHVLVQDEAPKAELLRRFRADGNAVLFGSGSFWEGVDVPGEALRLVIIDKLPFDVPSDPLVMARCERLKAQGKSPFADYQLPSAALTLKQGFGRLIRSTKDYGIVAVLDRRLVTKGYGKVLLRSLPVDRCITDWDSLHDAWNVFITHKRATHSNDVAVVKLNHPDSTSVDR